MTIGAVLLAVYLGVMAPVSASANDVSGSTIVVTEIPTVAPVRAVGHQGQSFTYLGQQRSTFPTGVAPATMPTQASDATELRQQIKSASRPGAFSAAGDDPKLSADQNFCVGLDASYQPGGVAVSYDRLCQVTTVQVSRYISGCRPNNCAPSGQATFRLIVVGYGARGDRSAGYVIHADAWKVQGANMENETLSISPYCLLGAGSLCELDSALDTTIGNWELDGGQGGTIIVTSPEQGAAGADKININDVGIAITAGFWTGAASNSQLLTSRELTCDSATYVTAGRGCRYTDFVPTFMLDAKQYPESARHIADALYKRVPVVPDPGGRTFPGSIESKQPLTRNYYDTNLQAAATKAKDAACAQYFPNKSAGYDCDEYPFTKTYQNAGSGGPFTIRAIPATDNRGAGGKFGSYLTDTRILDGNPFFVSIANTVPPTS